MSDPTQISPYAPRWHALLAEHTAIQNEHLELISSFRKPFSAKETMQLNVCTVRLHKLSLELHTLVDEWVTNAQLIYR